MFIFFVQMGNIQVSDTDTKRKRYDYNSLIKFDRM